MPATAPEAPQDARAPLAGSAATPAEDAASPGGPTGAQQTASWDTDPLADYAWRNLGLGVGQPLTWKQRRKMRWLITTGRAEPLPMAEQTCWVSADLRYCLAEATRVIVKPDGKMVLR